MSQTFSISVNGAQAQTFTTGGTNTAAGDATAFGALMGPGNQIINDLLAQARANPSSFNAQGAGGGATGGSTAAAAIKGFLQAALNNVALLPGC